MHCLPGVDRMLAASGVGEDVQGRGTDRDTLGCPELRASRVLITCGSTLGPRHRRQPWNTHGVCHRETVEDVGWVTAERERLRTVDRETQQNLQREANRPSARSGRCARSG
jgi:hypothetical protein